MKLKRNSLQRGVPHDQGGETAVQETSAPRPYMEATAKKSQNCLTTYLSTRTLSVATCTRLVVITSTFILVGLRTISVASNTNKITGEHWYN